MNKIIKVLAWIVGVISAFMFFSESTEQVFPVQVLAAIVLCGILYYANRCSEGVRYE